MVNSENPLEAVSPADVLGQIAAAVPEDCRNRVIVVGSLAVGYHYFGDQAEMVVRTKDADCLLSPRVDAVESGVAIADRLFEAGWEINKDGKWCEPGNESTPEEKLPAVRLHPPGDSGWFIELLTVPDLPANGEKQWMRIKTQEGDFGLPSFKFLALTNYEPILTGFGIHIARPEMMALASLLEHPGIEPDPMSAGFAGRPEIKRSNKDLGRVIAIGYLATGKEEDALLGWPESWKEALRERFPDEWRKLASVAGKGLRKLLESEQDLEQAWFTCVNGLLASNQPSLEEYKTAGVRFLKDVIEPLEQTLE